MKTITFSFTGGQKFFEETVFYPRPIDNQLSFSNELDHPLLYDLKSILFVWWWEDHAGIAGVFNLKVIRTVIDNKITVFVFFCSK